MGDSLFLQIRVGEEHAAKGREQQWSKPSPQSGGAGLREGFNNACVVPSGLCS